MARTIPGTALLVTALGVAALVAGDPHLLTTGNYRFLALLWTTHLAFWILYLAALGRPFLAAARPGPALPGDPVLADLLLGLGGLAYALGACRIYLHQDRGFFSASRLPLNLAAFAAVLLVLAGIFRALRGTAAALDGRRWAVPAAGAILTISLWAAALLISPPGHVALDLDAVEPAPGGPNPGTVKGAGEAGAGPPRRVVLLGLDGADWKVIDPLIEAGSLPAFALLKREGAAAPMRTVSPFSPVGWTTITTGMDPGRHSVQYFSEMYLPALDVTVQRLEFNFLEPLLSRLCAKMPVSSTTRTSRNLWEILDTFGRESLAINWWASFPADPIRGVLVSNYAIPWDEISPERVARLGSGDRRVHPPEVWPKVREALEEAVKDGLATGLGQAGEMAGRVTNTVFWDARDRIVLRLHEALRSPAFSLSAIYLQGIDTTSHHLSESVFGPNMNLPRPRKAPPQVEAVEWERLREAYRRMDGVVGSLAAALEEPDLLVVVSDHGWRFDGTSHWSAPDGVFAMYGAAVRRGAAPEQVSVYDVAPTILYYLGLPVSREMPGRILDAALAPETVARLPRAYVTSYGTRVRPARISGAETDAQYREKLRSLGFTQ